MNGSCLRRALFGLAASLLAGSGSVLHLHIDSIALWSFGLICDDHVTCSPEPVLRGRTGTMERERRKGTGNKGKKEQRQRLVGVYGID